MQKSWILLLIILLSACANKTPVRPFNEGMYYDEIDMEAESSITPQVYSLIAIRTTNKMLDGTRNLYENLNRPSIYVMDPKKSDPTLPDGFYSARKVTKDIIEGSRTFGVVNNMNDADYILEVFVERLGNNDSPEIAYKLVLLDNKNVKIGEWTETIKRIRNDDRSWW